MVTFYVLRQLLAPLWEALILLDRLLYLRELRYDAHLVPLFDPSLSPRSYALIAIKPEAYMTDDALQERVASLHAAGDAASPTAATDAARTQPIARECLGVMVAAGPQMQYDRECTSISTSTIDGAMVGRKSEVHMFTGTGTS